MSNDNVVVPIKNHRSFRSQERRALEYACSLIDDGIHPNNVYEVMVTYNQERGSRFSDTELREITFDAEMYELPDLHPERSTNC